MNFVMMGDGRPRYGEFSGVEMCGPCAGMGLQALVLVEVGG